MKVFVLFGFLVVSLMLTTTSFARSYDDIVESGYIEVAVYADFPPYSYQDKNDKPTGIDVDVAKSIAKQLEVDIRWYWMNAGETVEDDLRNAIWKGRITDKRKADLMLRVPYDSEFSKAVDGYGLAKNDLVVMFAPYHAEQWMVARDLAKVGDVRNLAVFRFEKIGVEIDSLPDFYLLGLYGGKLRDNVVHYENIDKAVAGLKRGEIAGVVGMNSQLTWSLGKKHKFDVDDDGLEQLANKEWDIGMAVGHKFRQLAYKLEDIVAQMVEDKQMEKIFNKYNAKFIMPEYRRN